MKLWHIHRYSPVKVNYPVLLRIRTSDPGDYYMEREVEGTAVYYKCECGEHRVLQMIGKRTIWNGAVIEEKIN